jgi:hypothetical protein
MSKTGRFTHGSTITSNVAAIGTTFDVTKFIYISSQFLIHSSQIKSKVYLFV